ncbi:MAG: ArnT family glycosyltransferase [Halioglobus sp.]
MENHKLAILLEKHEKAMLGIFWYGLAAMIVIGLGCVNLYYPFGFDQSVIMLGAESLAQGSTLYVDYWDNKQPGIYYLYHLGGELFGYSELGIHLFELIWLIVFSLVMIKTLQPFLHYSWVSALAPVATIGVYYATAGVQQLTQLEMPVGFPIYVSAWCAIKTIQNPDRSTRFCFAGGFAAGLAMLFKLVLAPLIACFWLVAILYLSRRGRSWLGSCARFGPMVIIGASLPLSIAAFYFWQRGALDEYLWTSFVYPTEVFNSAPPASKSRWVSAAAFYLLNFAPWGVFAAIACYRWLRSPSNEMIAMLVSWLLVAIALFLVQSFSWWEYHTLLFFIPTGLLAVFGLDAILKSIGDIRNKPRLVNSLASLIIMLPLCASLTAPFLKKAQPLLTVLWMQGLGVSRYHWAVDRKYQDLDVSANFLFGEEALPGPIYSFGYAGLYSMTNRNSPHPIPGSSWEFYLPEQNRAVLRTLEAKKVPYIFVDAYSYKIHFMNSDISGFLSEHYDLLKKDAAGTWYRRKSDASDIEIPVEQQ